MKRGVTRWWLPLTVFGAVLARGATMGLTDDEAYYWVLAQRPALGYAYHPPAVALCIAAAQRALGWWLGNHSVALVRLPAALGAAWIVALGSRWAERAGGGEGSPRAGLVLVAFAGIFSLVWMMVPDIPLFVGWTLAFTATWEVCFGKEAGAWRLTALAAGLALAILSKYSGVLGAVSAFAAIALWAPPERKARGLAAVVVGGLLAAAPILWWNSRHEWASILYQLRERHGGAELSAIRYARFWAVELVLMGPALAWYAARVVSGFARGQASRVERFALLWAAPAAAIFCLQPLWADFKPHWALIVWWPLALALAAAGGTLPRASRVHLSYGLGLIALVWTSCQYPLAAWGASWFRSDPMDPRLDVTNDLYGWPELPRFVLETAGEGTLRLPVTGSRYQTASQAAFALGSADRVSLLPRDLKSRDEWPDLGVSDAQGPGWPRLTQPILYVADNRYDAAPEYPDSTCVQARAFESRRYGYAAKMIYLWKCVPRSARP